MHDRPSVILAPFRNGVLPYGRNNKSGRFQLLPRSGQNFNGYDKKRRLFMKIKKRIARKTLAVLLCFSMILSTCFLASPALAFEPGDDESAAEMNGDAYSGGRKEVSELAKPSQPGDSGTGNREAGAESLDSPIPLEGEGGAVVPGNLDAAGVTTPSAPPAGSPVFADGLLPVENTVPIDADNVADYFKLTANLTKAQVQSGESFYLYFRYNCKTMVPDLDKIRIEVLITPTEHLNISISPYSLMEIDRDNGNDETRITYTFQSGAIIQAGTGEGELQVYLQTAAGITDHGTTYGIQVRFYYDDELVEDNSYDLSATVTAEKFDWSVDRGAVSPASSTVTSRTIPSVTFQYAVANNNLNSPSELGKVYTEQVTVTETIYINENVLLLPDANNVTVTGVDDYEVVFETDSNGFVTAIHLTLTKENGTFPDTDLSGFSPKVTISGATLAPAIGDNESVIAYTTRSNDNTQDSPVSLAAETPVYFGSDDQTQGGFYIQEATGDKQLTYTVTYQEPGPEIYDPQKTIINKTNVTSFGSSVDVYAGEGITYTITFSNAHTQTELTDYQLRDEPPKGVILTSIHSGYHYQQYVAGTTSYEDVAVSFNVILEMRDGTKITIPVTVAAGNQASNAVEIDLTTVSYPIGYSNEDIVAVIFDYGNVSPGFRCASPESGIKLAGTMQDIDTDLAQNNETTRTLTNDVQESFLFHGEEKTASASSELTYHPGYAEGTGTKAMKNLNSSRAAGVFLPGDLVEYTITYTNTTHKAWQGIYLVDLYDSGALNPYLDGTLQDGYTGENIRITSATDTSKIHSVAVTYPSAGQMTFRFYGENGTTSSLAPGESFTITYVMQIKDQRELEDAGKTFPLKISNSFEVWGYPLGGGPGPGSEPSQIGGGSNEGTVREKDLPRIGISRTIQVKPGGSWAAHNATNPTQTGETVLVSLYIKSEDIQDGGSVTLRNIVAALFLNENDAYEFPATVRYTHLGVGEQVNAGTIWESASVTSAEKSGGLVSTASTDKYLSGAFSVVDSGGNGMELQPGEQVVIQYELTMTGDIETIVANTQYGKQRLDHFFFFEQGKSDYTYTNSASAQYDDTSSNYDSDTKTNSRTAIFDNKIYGYGKDPSIIYAGIEQSAAPVIQTYDLQASGSYSREYTTSVINYSGALGFTGNAFQLNVEEVLIRIPVYERYDGNGITVRIGSALVTGFAVTESMAGSGNDAYQVLRIRFPGGVAIAAEGNQAASLDIAFSTVLAGEALHYQAANAPKAYDAIFQSAFIPAYGQAVASYSPSNPITFVEGTTDYAGSADAWQAAETTVNNNNKYVAPGVRIRAMSYELGSTGWSYVEYNGDNLTPSNTPGWRVTVENGAQSDYDTMENPVVIVKLPYGMNLNSVEDSSLFLGGAPMITTVNSQQVLTFFLEDSIDKGTSLSFHFNVTVDKYGEYEAEVYLTSSDIFKEASGTSGMGSLLPNLVSLEDMTAAPGYSGSALDFAHKRAMVGNTGIMKLLGTYKFSSYQTLEANGGECADSRTDKSIEIDRDTNTITYRLYLHNGSENTAYRDVVLLERLPLIGDLSVANPVARSSTFDIRLAEDAAGGLADHFQAAILSAGGGTTDVTSAVMRCFTTKDPGSAITDAELGNAASPSAAPSGWSGHYLSGATAFRVYLKELQPGETICITYTTELDSDTIPDIGALAANSFGFGFHVVENTAGDRVFLSSEPRMLAVTMDDADLATIQGEIFIDTNNDGVFDQGEPLYAGNVIVTLWNGDATVCRSETFSNGAYLFEKVPTKENKGDLDGLDYYVTFTIPSGYELTATDYRADFPSTRNNVFSLQGGAAEPMSLTATLYKTETLVFNAGLVTTGGGSGDDNDGGGESNGGNDNGGGNNNGGDDPEVIIDEEDPSLSGGDDDSGVVIEEENPPPSDGDDITNPGDADGGGTDLVLVDPDVPLGEVPKTGDAFYNWLGLAVLSAAGLFLLWKKRPVDGGDTE